jgi:hypothetical protein
VAELAVEAALVAADLRIAANIIRKRVTEAL